MYHKWRMTFYFTGLDVERVKDGIEISMDDYAKSLEEIQIRDAKADVIERASLQ